MKRDILQKNYRHETFGGIICASDFYIGAGDLHNSDGSPIASKICSDWKFDRACLLNAESREKRKEYEEMEGLK